MFKGSYVALVTPMNDDGSIDKESLEKLVSFHIENGTHGIVAVGTTGESATLPMDEHIDVVKHVVKYADGKIPVIAGTGANSTDEAVFLSKHIAPLGVEGFLSVVPYYNKPQQRGLIAHFNAVADATDLPVLLYNVPSRTVLDMTTDTVATLAEHPNIVGLKDATGDISRLREAKSAVPADFVILSGDDSTGCEFMCNGGDGVISVTANIAPDKMSQMCEAAFARDYTLAAQIDATVAVLHKDLFIESNPVIPKWALYKMGLINKPHMRLPLVLPELINQETIEKGLLELGLLQ